MVYSEYFGYSYVGENVLIGWDLNSGQELFRLPFSNGVQALLFRPDGSQLFTADVDGLIRVVDLPGGAVRYEKKLSAVPVSIGLLPNRQWLAAGDADGRVHFWRIGSENEETPLQVDSPGMSVWLDPRGERATTGNITGSEFNLVQVRSGRTLDALELGEDSRFLGFSPDGKLVLAEATDGTIRRWDTASGSELPPVNLGGEKKIQLFSNDSQRGVVQAASGEMEVWDVPGAQRITALENATGSSLFSFSPDGLRVVGSSDNGAICVWEATSGKQAVLPEPGERGVRSLLCPRGR